MTQNFSEHAEEIVGLIPPHWCRVIPSDGIILGRNVETDEDVILLDHERQSGLNIVGVAGAGKSTVMENIFVTDVINGHGGLFVDVQGDSTEHILARLPDDRLSA